MLATLAQQEQLRISERTKAGIARVRADGRPWGPARKRVNVARASELRQQGLSITAISRKMRTSRALIWNRLNHVTRTGRGEQ